MLAPGDYLLMPVSDEPVTVTTVITLTVTTVVRPAEGNGEQTQTARPVVKAEEHEHRSFLEILLRALGAVHT